MIIPKQIANATSFQLIDVSFYNDNSMAVLSAVELDGKKQSNFCFYDFKTFSKASFTLTNVKDPINECVPAPTVMPSPQKERVSFITAVAYCTDIRT